jgi:hypothetical protein
VGVELVDRIEDQELDSGAAEDLGPRDLGEDRLHLVGGALVAVGDGLLEQPPRRVDQSVVDGPRVDAHRFEGRLQLPRGRGRDPNARLDAVEEDAARPPQVAIREGRRVVEPVDFLEKEAVFLQAAQHGPPAAGPEIDCEV